MLHPQYKTSYFHKAGWPCEWITTAEALLHEEWSSNYKPAIIPMENTSVTVNCAMHILLLITKTLLYIVQASSSCNKYFDSFDTFNNASTMGDPIDKWLNTPPISNIGNGLQYWTAMAISGHPSTGTNGNEFSFNSW